jgi:hypothetical protein
MNVNFSDCNRDAWSALNADDKSKFKEIFNTNPGLDVNSCFENEPKKTIFWMLAHTQQWDFVYQILLNNRYNPKVDDCPKKGIPVLYEAVLAEKEEVVEILLTKYEPSVSETIYVFSKFNTLVDLMHEKGFSEKYFWYFTLQNKRSGFKIRPSIEASLKIDPILEFFQDWERKVFVFIRNHNFLKYLPPDLKNYLFCYIVKSEQQLLADVPDKLLLCMLDPARIERAVQHQNELEHSHYHKVKQCVIEVWKALF